jgi:hypothetical protein
MTPGRELDALVAEKVMGLTVYPEGRDHVGPCWSKGGFHEEQVPNYSTDIAAAWSVVEAFTSGNVNGHSCHSSVRFGAGNQSWNAWFAWGTERHEAHGESPMEAICLAALKAVGLSVQGAYRRHMSVKAKQDRIAELEAILAVKDKENYELAGEILRMKAVSGD